MSHFANDPKDALLLWGPQADSELPNYIQPTAAVPGSIEKIKILRQRADINAPLFHPEDRSDLAGVKEPVFIFKSRTKEKLQ